MIDISKVTAAGLRDGAFETELPELYALKDVVEISLWHDHQSVFDHIVDVYDHVSLEITGIRQGIVRADLLKIATLLHDIAKKDIVVTRSDGTVGCPAHELIAASRVRLFAPRFGLDNNSENIVERIVRYHGFISEILNVALANGNKEKYLSIFRDVTNREAIELVVLMKADILGCDLEKNDKIGFDARIGLLQWMFETLSK